MLPPSLLQPNSQPQPTESVTEPVSKPKENEAPANKEEKPDQQALTQKNNESGENPSNIVSQQKETASAEATTEKPQAA